MSRIGKAIIIVPAGVTVNVNADNQVTVKGPKGTLNQVIHPDMKIELNGAEMSVVRPSDEIRHKALHGLTRALVANMVTGVTDGYKRQLELVGVGFKATNTGNLLDMSLGYSHNIVFEIPSELSLITITEKGSNPKIILEGSDKQLIGSVASKIRSLRKPEPYKGKGVRYSDEIIRRKAGKSAGK